MDLAAIKARMRAARQKWTPVGDLQFLVTRPTQLDFVRMSARGVRGSELNLQLVVESVSDWKGVTARVLDPTLTGDDDTAVPFDAEVFEMLVGDRVDILTELAGAIGAMSAAAEAKAVEKKS